MGTSSFKWIAAVIAVAAIAAVVSNLGLPPRCTPLRGAGALSLELGRPGRGQARLFCYGDDAGRKIRFILARGSDGAVHSVFDACRQCYRYRRGYRLTRNGSLVCRVCGNRYSVDHMMTGKASCAPVAVPHQQAGSMVRINTADIRAGRGLF
jgi:uncharacterized membrane protein